MPTNIVWSDIDSRIVSDGQGNIKLAYNLDAIKSSLDNILRTGVGERVMLPVFGTNIVNSMFENFSDELIKDLGDDVKEACELWEKRAIITSVRFFKQMDINTIVISVRFEVNVTGEEGVVEVAF